MITQSQNVASLISTYTSNARFNSRHCGALAIQLQRSAPSDLTKEQRAMLKLVGERAAEVDSVRKARARVAPPSLRGPRNAVGAAWTALNGALLAVASVPSDVGPEGPEASELAATLFPEGMGFVTLDAVAVWSESRERFERITEDKLRKRIDAVVSPRLLESAERAYAQLGEAIGVAGALVAVPAPRALSESVGRFSYAVGAYARALSVSVVDTDDASLRRFLDALAPVDAMRVTQKTGEDEGELDEEDGDPTPETPTPGMPLPVTPSPVTPSDPNGGPFVKE